MTGIGQLCHMHRQQRWRDHAEPGQPRQRALAVLLHIAGDLVGGFMDMHVNRQVEFIGEHPNA
jgi:hypothetical protein